MKSKSTLERRQRWGLVKAHVKHSSIAYSSVLHRLCAKGRINNLLSLCSSICPSSQVSGWKEQQSHPARSLAEVLLERMRLRSKSGINSALQSKEGLSAPPLALLRIQGSHCWPLSPVSLLEFRNLWLLSDRALKNTCFALLGLICKEWNRANGPSWAAWFGRLLHKGLFQLLALAPIFSLQERVMISLCNLKLGVSQAATGKLAAVLICCRLKACGRGKGVKWSLQ